VWGLAFAGIVLTAAGGIRYPKLSMALYLAMGWLIVVAVKPLWLRMPANGLYLLAAGGLAYTAGIAFYAAKKVRYGHFVWHLFVIAGSSFHFAAVLKYAG
jgi:hemolysin III